MDIFTNEGTAERIGQRHEAINKHFVKAGKATAIAALATASLIQKILDRFRQKGGKQGPGLVEIKIDNKLVYKGIAGQKPEIDKLTPEHKAKLESVLLRPQPTTSKNIEISVDGEVAYKSENSIEKINELDPSSSNEQEVANQKQPRQQEANNLSALVSGQNILKNAKSNSYENQDYRIEQGSNGIVVSATDGRGEIARINKSGKMTGTVITKDAVALKEIANQLEQSQTINNLSHNQVPTQAESQLNEKQGAPKPKAQLALAGKNEESEELER